MASSADALLALRAAIATSVENEEPLEQTTRLAIATDGSEPQDTSDISAATHLIITNPTSQSFPLNAPTRFFSNETPIDLRSIFFAYTKRDVDVVVYRDEANAKNLSILPFLERIDLIAWLSGSSDSEHIRALEGGAAGTDGVTASQIAAGATGGAAGLPSGGGDRLTGIYKHERRLGDRKSILRGIKPTVSPLGLSVSRTAR